MAFDSSQVNPIVRANLVPEVTFSTWCLLSAPEVNVDTRPALGSTVLFNLSWLSTKTKEPPWNPGNQI